ncbi:hypothetical protein GCM10007190_00650 [Macrococcus hajekii]|nr:DUF2513 domain-containing protein [Macrococcus hajekii]GGA96462.1 hypothetical protein GCM10007190_00650 [Macrococcus hajekii]
MKLNQDLVRELLLIVEEEKAISEPLTSFNFKEHEIFTRYTLEEVVYTFQKLKEANYIDFKASYGDGIIMFYQIGNLTWEGHKFLDTIRDDKVWREAKEETSKLKSVPINIISSVAAKLVESQLGL